MYTSPHPDVEIPEVPLTPFALTRATDLGDKPAIVDGPSGRTLTFADLARDIDRVAGSLAARGFAKGDVFAIFSPNVPEYAVVFHAVATLGGINTTANPLYSPEELAFQLNDAGARFIFTVPDFIENVKEAVASSHVEEIFVLGEAAGATPYADLLQGDHPVPEVEIDPLSDIVVLPYSSGTTGYPKGVMLTHHNLVSNTRQVEHALHVTEDDVVIGVLPFFHIYGMVVVMNIAISKGATVVSMPRFDLKQFLDIMQDYRVTRAYLVPPIVLALAKHPMVDDYDLSSLHMIMSGAAPLGSDLADACADRLDCIVMQGYGLTETSPVTHVVPDAIGANRPGSIGPPISNTRVRVIDPQTGADLGPGEDGEILISGPQVMQGYLNNPEATANTIDPDGWLHTGDIGHADEEGYFYIVDRLKELIKYKGFQVAPAVLEGLLLTHPAVADAAVIPSPDEEAGEIPKAFIVLKGEASADELMVFVARHVAPHEKLRAVEFVEEIPKSASGKILRRVLVQRERERLAG